ncbi:MAG: hypothetical protein SH856_06740 [Flavobacteriales bacterium]|nr:hypothetical protein [Flavobacteriales bacterium]
MKTTLHFFYLKFVGLLLVLVLSACTFKAQSVEIAYLDKDYIVLEGTEGACYKCTIQADPANLYHLEIYDFWGGHLVMSGSYSDAMLENEEGLFQYFFTNGIKKAEGQYSNGMKIGDWKRWDWWGVPKVDYSYPTYAGTYASHE